MSDNPYEAYKVSVPEGRSGEMRVSRFTMKEAEVENLRLALHGRRQVPPGTYTRLSEGSTVWMSDTPEEIDTHRPAMNALSFAIEGARVLIHGLGLGMIVQHALRTANVARVDVVERDPNVIALVAPHYEAMAAQNGKELNIVHGSAFDRIWAPGTRWDVVWHDIWPSYTPENLPEMAHLHRMFGHRCEWQGSWGRKECERIKSGAFHRQHERIVSRFLKSLGYNEEKFRAQLAAARFGSVDERGA